MPSVPVSLIIPTYNRGLLISETIDSALSQSIKFHEIIVVDDGSTDETVHVLQKYQKLIRYIKTKNQGVQAARNLGINEARCELISLCDSDDLLEVDYLASTAPWMLNTEEQDILFSNFCTFREGLIDFDKLSKAPFDFIEGARREGSIAFDIPNLYARSVQYQPLFTSGMMVRKKFIEINGGYDAALNGVGSEDWDFTLRAINTGKVAFCIKPLVRVRKHLSNDSGDNIKMLLGEIRILESALRNPEAAKVAADLIKKSIVQRRENAFNEAYARGLFELVLCLEKDLGTSSFLSNRSIKTFIAKMPVSIRSSVWKVTQHYRINSNS
jgi:glycosyltransferase involved in cell wall biosynthesis